MFDIRLIKRQTELIILSITRSSVTNFTLCLTHPWEFSATRHVIPCRRASRGFHTIFHSICIVGLILLPESITHHLCSIHPFPRQPVVCTMQANPGDAIASLHKIHLVLCVYNHQICSSFLTVFSAAFPAFSYSISRDVVAFAVELYPSFETRFAWRKNNYMSVITSKRWLRFGNWQVVETAQKRALNKIISTLWLQESDYSLVNHSQNEWKRQMTHCHFLPLHKNTKISS